eukprot:242515_1
MGSVGSTIYQIVELIVVHHHGPVGLLVFRIVHEGVVTLIDIIDGQHECVEHCGGGVYASIECDEEKKETAVCKCDPCGKPIQHCIPHEDIEKVKEEANERRRRLGQETAPSLPYLDECTQNERCRNMMSSYRYDGLDPSDIQSPEDRCTELEYECTDQELELFQNAINEISANFPTSSEEMCSGFYHYLDDGTPRTFDEAEAVCQDDFLSDLARIQTEQQFDCAISTIGDGSSPWIRYDEYSLDQNRHHSHRMYGYEHINCDQPQTAVLCYSSICLAN